MKHFVMWLWSVQKENNSLHTRLSFLLVQLSSSQCWNPYQDGSIQFCLCQKTYPQRISETYLPLCTPERYGLTYFFYCYEFLVKYLASIRNMSLVAHQFGRVEFRIFVFIFSIINIRNVQIDELPRTINSYEQMSNFELQNQIEKWKTSTYLSWTSRQKFSLQIKIWSPDFDVLT